MKVIDLLNKRAKGEEVPKIIKFDNFKYYWNDVIDDYENVNEDYLFSCTNGATEWLNEEIEIIEEDKKIEKLGMFEEAYCDSAFDGIVFKKINELIDEVNKLKGEKNEKGNKR